MSHTALPGRCGAGAVVKVDLRERRRSAGRAINIDCAALSTSKRISETDSPIIVKTKRLAASTEGCLSLAQGETRPEGTDPLSFPLLSCPASLHRPVSNVHIKFKMIN
jgi:hypothetical protein